MLLFDYVLQQVKVNVLGEYGRFKMQELVHLRSSGDIILRRILFNLLSKVNRSYPFTRLSSITFCVLGQAAESINLRSTYIALGWSDSTPTMVCHH